MFTGLVEATAAISEIKQNESGMTRLRVNKPALFDEGVSRGDSVAINGICLTVVNEQPSAFLDFDLGSQTLKDSNLDQLKIDEKVHLERAALLTSRLGGHIVSGHIDTTAIISSLKKDEAGGWILEIKVPKFYQNLMIPKGSLAVDGTSLTIQTLEYDQKDFVGVAIMLIPETLRKTRFMDVNIGDSVNLEFDLIGKYVLRYLESSQTSNL